MVVSTTKVKQAMGLTPKPNPKPNPKPKLKPKPPQISVPDLLNLVEELKSRESRLKTELAELNLLHKPLESELINKTRYIDELLTRVNDLEAENNKLVNEVQVTKAEFVNTVKEKDVRIGELINEVQQLSLSHRYLGLVEVANKSNLIKNLGLKKSSPSSSSSSISYCAAIDSTTKLINNNNNNVANAVKFNLNNVVECEINVPRVPKPPPEKRYFPESPAILSSSNECTSAPPLPPLPQGRVTKKLPCNRNSPPPPPPPPLSASGVNFRTAKVKRVPEVVEFYHSLMRRDTRRDNGVVAAEVTGANSAKDLVGEIENRSAYLLAIKTDVETQGDFIRFLIKEVETAAFKDIEDVVSFVKWLDDELSYLVDERAVLKHFDWPEKKADGLREAAFEYSDLKKLESEASSFRHDTHQACSTTLKRMQTLLEKLEHGVYNLSRLRESATNRFKSFQIPVDWMLDTGFVSQIKLASVKLAMKYMKRVLAELEIVCGGPEEEELIVQGVRFAFRVHQFAGGFDVETMTAFEELRDKARAYHVQCQNQQQQRLACKSMPC